MVLRVFIALTGYLQSPGWHPKATLAHPGFVRSLDAWGRIPIPVDHVIMNSFLHVDVGGGDCKIMFYRTSDSEGSRGYAVEDIADGPPSNAFEKLGQQALVPFVFPPVNGEPLIVIYHVRQGAELYTGFRLLFSFHRVCAEYQRTLKFSTLLIN